MTPLSRRPGLHRRTTLALGLTAVLALGATACGTGTSATKTPAGTSSSAAKDGAAITTLDGGTVNVPGDRPAARQSCTDQ